MNFINYLNQEEANLIMMIGLSGSGKTTIAKEISNQLRGNEVIILSSDDLRKELLSDENDQTHNDLIFSTLKNRAFHFFSSHKNGAVIIDATNLSVKDRSWIFHSWKKDNDCYKIACIISTPFDICKIQNSKRERTVPEYVLDRQIRKFEIPFYEEGWDKIVIWNVEDENIHRNLIAKQNIGSPDILMHEMEGFNQKNHHHLYDLGTHCFKTYMEMNKKIDNPILLRASQIHDAGKKFTQVKKEDSEECSYHQHHNYGAYYLLSNWENIGIRNWMKIDTVDDLLNCLFYINYHMIPFFIESEKSIKKYKELWGEEKFNNLMMFNECDKIASGTERKTNECPKS